MQEIEVVDYVDGIKIAEEAEQKLLDSFEWDGTTITINIAYPYHIEAKRIKNQSDLISWIYHLLGKPWMTSAHIRMFIEIVCEIKSWKIN